MKVSWTAMPNGNLVDKGNLNGIMLTAYSCETLETSSVPYPEGR